MSIYIVRPRLTGQAADTGKEGAQAVVIREMTESKAKAIGAKQLGLPLSAVEVIETDGGGGSVIGVLPGQVLDPDELKDVMSQGAEIVPGTWESIHEQ